MALFALVACKNERPREDPTLIDGRVWLERRPEKHTDKVHATIFLTGYNIGLFDERSSYAGRHELFEFTRTGGDVKGLFPQSDKKFTINFVVRACDDAPPFDLCLDLSSNPWNGPKRYYGFRDPDAESRELGTRAHSLRAAARTLAESR
jgi:hypothetical protein